MTTATMTSPTSGSALGVWLWIAQFVVAAIFLLAGGMKTFIPIAELSQVIHWTGELPTWFVRAIGVIDLAGGIGIILPALTRIKPGLTVWAALGCSLVQVLSILFHVSRGEASVTPLNFVLLACALFVLWGRFRKAPISARGR